MTFKSTIGNGQLNSIQYVNTDSAKISKQRIDNLETNNNTLETEYHSIVNESNDITESGKNSVGIGNVSGLQARISDLIERENLLIRYCNNNIEDLYKKKNFKNKKTSLDKINNIIAESKRRQTGIEELEQKLTNKTENSNLWKELIKLNNPNIKKENKTNKHKRSKTFDGTQNSPFSGKTYNNKQNILKTNNNINRTVKIIREKKSSDTTKSSSNPIKENSSQVNISSKSYESNKNETKITNFNKGINSDPNSHKNLSKTSETGKEFSVTKDVSFEDADLYQDNTLRRQGETWGRRLQWAT